MSATFCKGNTIIASNDPNVRVTKSSVNIKYIDDVAKEIIQLVKNESLAKQDAIVMLTSRITICIFKDQQSESQFIQYIWKDIQSILNMMIFSTEKLSFASIKQIVFDDIDLIGVRLSKERKQQIEHILGAIYNEF